MKTIPTGMAARNDKRKPSTPPVKATLFAMSRIFYCATRVYLILTPHYLPRLFMLYFDLATRMLNILLLGNLLWRRVKKKIYRI
jgi:hypothetical protein